MCLPYVFEHSNVNSVQSSHDGHGSVYFAILNESLAGFGAFPVLSKYGSPSCSSQGFCSCPDHPGAPHASLQFPLVSCLCGRALVAGELRAGFSEKLPEASVMSARAKASWLQDGPALIKAEPIRHSGSALGMS